MIASASSSVGRLHVEIAGAQAHLDARGLAFDGKQRGAGHRRRERLRAAHAAEARGQDPLAGKVAAVMLAARPRRRSRRCPARSLACRYRSRSPRSSGRTSSGPCDRARGSDPRSPNAARGWNWRSARAAHRHGCGRRRPACPIGRAASRRLRAASAPRRCGRSSPSRAPRGRCRHRRRARPAARRPRRSRLFISMRNGASVSQLLAVSSAPRGARMTAGIVDARSLRQCLFLSFASVLTSSLANARQKPRSPPRR